MTDKLRARAKELADEACKNSVCAGEHDYVIAALLQFAREALREEPDAEMLQAAAMSCEWPHWYSDANVKEICVEVWTDMIEARARGLE
jgi:hypothetical protein